MTTSNGLAAALTVVCVIALLLLSIFLLSRVNDTTEDHREAVYVTEGTLLSEPVYDDSGLVIELERDNESVR